MEDGPFFGGPWSGTIPDGAYLENDPPAGNTVPSWTVPEE